MATNELRATLREDFYALEQNLPRGDAGALRRHDGGSRAIRNNELECESLHDLDRARRDPDVTEASTENARGAGGAREYAIFGILVEDELRCLRVRDPHTVGMRYGSVWVQTLWVDRDPGMTGAARSSCLSLGLVLHGILTAENLRDKK